MQVYENYDLTPFNTFGVPARAKYFTQVETQEEFLSLIKTGEFQNNPRLILGGGSNVLFTKDFEGLVILNKLKGMNIISETDQTVTLRVMGGVVWHDLVLFAVSHEYWGIENLSLIPGTVGAAPMQNIGAYGAELRDTLESVVTIELATGEAKVFQNKDCHFGYRDSIFKNEVKGKYFITSIILKLSKIEQKNISYRALEEHFTKTNTEPKTIGDISNAVTEIRESKLPNPKVLGNAGSFFKNIFIDEEELRELQQSYPDIPNFREGDQIKIPAGWFIEACGYKGKRVGNVGMHDKQALVLVNYSGATGLEIKAFAAEVIASVNQKFGLILTPEVNIV